MEIAAATATAPPTAAATSPMDAAAWKKQLKPWLSALRDAHLSIDLPPLPTVSDMESLWLRIFSPRQRRNNPGVWLRLIEAMELLELLARVDHRSAWELLFEVAGERLLVVGMYEDLLVTPSGGRLLPRFVLCVNHEELEDATTDTIQGCICLIVENEQGSPKCKAAKESLLAMWVTQHGGRALDREVDGRVKVSLDFDSRLDFEDEDETGYVFTQIQNVAFAHEDPSLLVVQPRPGEQEGEAADQEAEGQGQADEVDGGEESDGGESDEEQEEGEDSDHDGSENEASAAADAATSAGEESGSSDGNEDAVPANPDPPSRGAIEIESFRLRLMDFPLSNLVLYLINEVGKSGMSLSHFTVSTLWHERLHHSVIGSFLLNQLVPWRGRRDGLGIETLKIDLGGFDAAGVRAFCTAISHSRSLREFSLEQDAGMIGENPIQAKGDVWWPWLAYALFSGDADHHIHTVSLNMALLEAKHVASIREVLDESDPLAFLYQTSVQCASAEDDGETSTRSSDTATKSSAMAASLSDAALIRLGHHRVVAAGRESDIPAVRVREPGVTYQIVRNRPDEEYIEILLPGTGVCWVDRSDLVALTPLTRREAHSIRHLILKYLDDESVPALIELLPLIGSPLEQLTIATLEGTNSQALFAAIWASCPKLKRLDLNSCAMASLDWLYEHRSDACPLEALSLSNITVDDSASWSKLFSTLSDSANPLTQSLRQLHLDLQYFNRYDVVKDKDILTKCFAMLTKNHQLSYCQLTNCRDAMAVAFKERVEVHHKEPICVQEAPMCAMEKLAFLSVITPAQLPGQRKQAKYEDHRTPGRNLARYKLDPPVLQSIMAFAAKEKRRVCSLSHRSLVSEA